MAGWDRATELGNLTDCFTNYLNHNLAAGDGALSNNTTGYFNTAIGAEALRDNTTGQNNAAFGAAALRKNITGDFNTAFGSQALGDNTTGSWGLAFGSNALRRNTVGSYNLAVGAESLVYNTSGEANLVLGHFALYLNQTGGGNTALGHSALQNSKKDNNVAVGSGALLNLTMGSNVIGIGTDIESAGGATGDNYITMGKGNGDDRIFNQFDSNAVWYRVSDERIKKEIRTNKDCGLDFINSLRTVTYKKKAPSERDESQAGYNKKINKASYDKKMYGFVAQEVKQALIDNHITDFAGHTHINDDKDDMQAISYEMFVIPLVKAVQELSNDVIALQAKVRALESNSTQSRISRITRKIKDSVGRG